MANGSFPKQSSQVEIINFTPALDVAAILNDLLDAYERRFHVRPLDQLPHKAVRCNLASLSLPAYHSQTDPAPRQITNEQLQTLERAGWVKLAWLPGEAGHLLESVTLIPGQVDTVFKLLQRTPVASYRARLVDLLLGERFRFSADWRQPAIDETLDQLQAEKSPAPFNLTDDGFNRDLLTALATLDNIGEETPYRVFSVRIFNDSKRFEVLMGAVATLARRHQPEWKGLSNDEVLRELNLVANPGHLYLRGPWQLIDVDGQIISLGEFQPSVGLPSAQAARLQKATVEASGVICIENQTSFYELIRNAKPAIAALCLWGNPSPACRHLLCCLPEETPLLVWADIDYGGLNILAQLREQVNPNARPYLMDVETLEAHARWARPLTPADINNLARLRRRPSLSDMQPLVNHLLNRGLKLEQEAIGRYPGLA